MSIVEGGIFRWIQRIRAKRTLETCQGTAEGGCQQTLKALPNVVSFELEVMPRENRYCRFCMHRSNLRALLECLISSRNAAAMPIWVLNDDFAAHECSPSGNLCQEHLATTSSVQINVCNIEQELYDLSAYNGLLSDFQGLNRP